MRLDVLTPLTFMRQDKGDTLGFKEFQKNMVQKIINSEIYQKD